MQVIHVLVIHLGSWNPILIYWHTERGKCSGIFHSSISVMTIKLRVFLSYFYWMTVCSFLCTLQKDVLVNSWIRIHPSSYSYGSKLLIMLLSQFCTIKSDLSVQKPEIVWCRNACYRAIHLAARMSNRWAGNYGTGKNSQPGEISRSY